MTTLEGELSPDPAKSFQKNFLALEEKVELIRIGIADKVDQGQNPTMDFYDLTQAIHSAILNLVEMRCTSAVMMEIQMRDRVVKMQ